MDEVLPADLECFARQVALDKPGSQIQVPRGARLVKSVSHLGQVRAAGRGT